MAAQTGAEVIYPSAFTSYGNVSGIKVVKDVDVVDIYKTLQMDRGLAENWQFKAVVLEAAARLLFPLQNWAVAQRANTMLCKYQLSFVNDTVLVAVGHNRPTSVKTRASLFLDLGSDNRIKYNDTSHVDKYLPMESIDKLTGLSNGAMLCNLSDTPAKIIDLVETLYVMFGAGE